MHINDLFKRDKTTFSFELFPPKDAASSALLFETVRSLRALDPSYVSVTYGAGGSTRELTHDLVVKIQKETDLTVVSHLTAVGTSTDEIKTILDHYTASGIQNVMALRGDPPRGQSAFVPAPDGFSNATELVAFIKRNFPSLGIGVAGYPEGHPAAPNRLKEIDFLKAKVDAGADYICTQLFFDNRDFFDFRERCELAGITVPILAGIMPITSRKTMERMADLANRTRYPAKLLRAVMRVSTDDDFEKVGTHWATEQVLELLDYKVRGIHFYTLNRCRAAMNIYNALGVRSSKQLA